MKKQQINNRQKIKRIFSFLFCVCLIIIISLSLSIRLKLVNSFFGYQPWLVKTQSMKPTFQPGDLIISSVASKENTEVNDVVVFKTMDGNILTHRIVSKIDNEFVTKGDANNVNDEGVLTQERIIGKQVVRVPFLGKIILFTQSISGVIFLLICGLFIFFLKKLMSLLKKQEVQHGKERVF